ncbi:Lipoprotein-releasing system ATP-binding protein LolD [Dorea longicatena]|uniref:Lipoprotein-releasing system ATP-binding protein LolD n=1 Tax=Dorea longicatena TaxID=88431 RepID=A0A564UPT3_9FIRM|nr:ABC transporter ATP-binding protein [Dorea longicatena]VUX21252.1 Lipoprotein-releasing system ATP-binding protein LolD [Dorea longicatena]
MEKYKIKRYDEKNTRKEIKTKVLKGVDLSISKGEFVCIFGESGSGKSTLLNILGLLDDATIGTYKLDGVDIRKLSKKESAFIRNQKIGFVFQAYHLIPELNALENLVVPLGYAGMRKKEREKIAYELLTEFGIDDLEKKHVSQMSGGEQQRIAIMRAIINKPQILLADEPTGNLDKENSQTIINLFERLNKQGMTIVMVTHDTSLAKYGTRVVHVEDGRIIEKGKEILK